MYDIVALGELLVDFIQEGMNEDGHPLYSANPGGAPCNMLAMAAKMGKKTGFIGKVGDDSMGHMLQSAITSCGIDGKGLCFDKTVPTTLAFVSKTEDGDRSFSFYRNPGADVMLNEIDVINGRTTSKVNANSLLSRKMIIYKGNLYQLKRKRDTSNSEISYIERIKL